MKKLVIILVVLALIGGAIWFLFFKGGDEGDEIPADQEQRQAQDFPARFDESGAAASATGYESEFSGLKFSYPENWNVTKGADNSEESQLLTVESPLDENEFYFCVDMNVTSDETGDRFVVADAEVLDVKQLESGNNSVIYRTEAADRLLWAVTGEDVSIGDTEFISELAGQSGYRMQLFGRFDCREFEDVRDITTRQFQLARWLREAESIVESVEF